MKNSKSKIVSFDIFDTCLVRTCGQPKNIFYILAYKILGDVEFSMIADFVQIRICGEKEARRNTSHEDVTLKEIYSVCDFSGLTSCSNESIQKMEQEVEKDQLTAVYNIKEIINKYRKENREIIFISDMYLTSNFLKSVLKEQDIYKDGDKIFVSCEIKLSKFSGNLYKYISSQFGYKYRNWIHYGDNLYSDYIIPKRLGIKCIRVSQKYTFYERFILKNKSLLTRETTTITAGISRSIRIFQKEDIHITFAADLIAPIFVPFTFYVMQDALKKGINKLFFFSRDGYLFFKIAQAFQYCGFFKDIEISYLYVSRSALYFPSFNIDSDSLFLKDLYQFLKTIEKQEKFSNFLSDFISEDITNLLISYIPTLQSNISGQEAFKLISESSQAISLMKNYIKEQRNLILRYFIQEGLATHDNKIAIFDLRGTRKCHSIINTILRNNEFKTSHGYYFEVMDDRIKNDKSDSYEALIYDELVDSSPILRSYLEIGNILEQYFSLSPHKRTSCYKMTTKVQPVFDSIKVSAIESHISNINISVCKQYAYYYINTYIYHNNMFNLNIGLNMLIEFTRNPQRRYLKALTAIEGGKSNHKKLPLVRFLSARDLIKRNYIWGRGSLIWTFRTPYIYSLANIIKKLSQRINVKLK